MVGNVVMIGKLRWQGRGSAVGHRNHRRAQGITDVSPQWSVLRRYERYFWIKLGVRVLNSIDWQ